LFRLKGGKRKKKGGKERLSGKQRQRGQIKDLLFVPLRWIKNRKKKRGKGVQNIL